MKQQNNHLKIKFPESSNQLSIQQTSKMSSICKALNISGETLSKCTGKTQNKYCEQHKHKHRLEKPDECAVCFENISSETETPLECGHWIHKKCIAPTNVHKCPLCQNKLTTDEITFIFGEGHTEQNNYNDGMSIYFNPTEHDENAYSEFGHSSDDEHDSDDDAFEEFDEDTRLALLFYDEETYGDEIDEAIQNMNIDNIANEIVREELESEFFNRDSILTFLPESERNMVNETRDVLIYDVVHRIFYHENKHSEENRFWCDEEECVNIVTYWINHVPQSKRMFTVLCNLQRCQFDAFMRIAYERIEGMIERVVANKMDMLNKNNECPLIVTRRRRMLDAIATDREQYERERMESLSRGISQ